MRCEWGWEEAARHDESGQGKKRIIPSLPPPTYTHTHSIHPSTPSSHIQLHTHNHTHTITQNRFMHKKRALAVRARMVSLGKKVAPICCVIPPASPSCFFGGDFCGDIPGRVIWGWVDRVCACVVHGGWRSRVLCVCPQRINWNLSLGLSSAFCERVSNTRVSSSSDTHTHDKRHDTREPPPHKHTPHPTIHLLTNPLRHICTYIHVCKQARTTDDDGCTDLDVGAADVVEEFRLARVHVPCRHSSSSLFMCVV